MIGVIIGSRKVGINPDNVATPIAASLGDLITLSLLAGVSSTLYQYRGEDTQQTFPTSFQQVAAQTGSIGVFPFRVLLLLRLVVLVPPGVPVLLDPHPSVGGRGPTESSDLRGAPLGVAARHRSHVHQQVTTQLPPLHLCFS